MSSERAIKLTGISKCYQGYGKPVHRLLQALYKTKKKLFSEFWALRNVNLQVLKGETVGIIGRNGSGKSTLLQIIAGTLAPTGGEMEIDGRVSAILELGAGFNPEFSGRENARLNASIVGLTKEEIQTRMPEIIEFSELGAFIDQPVKTYSSGMYVRLAFSVSINISPDILIIDEALAVGDIKFQRKCFRKLDELKSKGVSIILVTHATDAVLAHCDRAMFLEDGQVRAFGEPKDVVNRYLEHLFLEEEDSPKTLPLKAAPRSGGGLNLDPAIDACKSRANYNPSEYRWGNGNARIIDFRVLDEQDTELVHQCKTNQKIRIQAAVHFFQPTDNIVYGLTVKTVDGLAVFGSNSEKALSRLDEERIGTLLLEYEITMNLSGGDYFFSLGVVRRDTSGSDVVLDRRYDLFHLNVAQGTDSFGIANLPFNISVGLDASTLD